jgi:hypothetical protein
VASFAPTSKEVRVKEVKEANAKVKAVANVRVEAKEESDALVDLNGLARNASLATAAVLDADRLAIGRELAPTHQMNVERPMPTNTEGTMAWFMTFDVQETAASILLDP